MYKTIPSSNRIFFIGHNLLGTRRSKVFHVKFTLPQWVNSLVHLNALFQPKFSHHYSIVPYAFLCAGIELALSNLKLQNFKPFMCIERRGEEIQEKEVSKSTQKKEKIHKPSHKICFLF